MSESEDSPFVQMVNLTFRAQISFQALWVAAELGLADLLADGPRRPEDLAKSTGTHPQSLYRLLRALATVGAVREQEGRTFSLTPLGATLRSGPGSLRGAVRFYGHPFRMHAWEEFLYSVRTGERAFDRAYGAPLFDWLKDHPKEAEVFNAAMSSLTGRLVQDVVASYDFASIGTLVDVGGGHGTLLATLLKANASMRGVLFDLPGVVAGARETLSAHGVADRCTVVGGSFFDSVPSGGDAYIMKSIIHDWDDDESLTILRNCRAAMSSGGRVLLIERVVPGPDEPDYGKLLDLEMLVLPGGQERTQDEYAALLARAGLKLTRIVPTGQGPSIIEAAPA